MNLTYPYRLCTHIRGYHALLTEINKNNENRFSADGTENVGERVGNGGAKRAMAVIKE
jgi:hypothetical protein